MKDQLTAELMKKWEALYTRKAQVVTPKLLEFCKAFEVLRVSVQESWFRPELRDALARAHVALDELVAENAQMVEDIQRKDEERKASEAQQAAVREQVNAELERLRSQVKELRDQAVTARMKVRPVTSPKYGISVSEEMLAAGEAARKQVDALVALEELRTALREVTKERDDLKAQVAEKAKLYQDLANSWNAWQANLDAGASKRELKEAGKQLDRDGAQAFRLARALLRLAAQEPKK